MDYIYLKNIIAYNGVITMLDQPFLIKVKPIKATKLK